LIDVHDHGFPCREVKSPKSRASIVGFRHTGTMSRPNTSATPSQEPLPPAMGAAAQAYELAMQPATTTPPTVSAQPADTVMKDVVMTDNTPDRPASPTIPLSATNVPSPAPQRTGTPSRSNGNDITSRATSQHPDPAPTIPKEAPPYGAPVRQYLNSKVTGPLMDGIKLLAKEKPNDPLRVLGEYLLLRSKELEGQ
jgi:COMPASS component SDC1